MAKKARKSNGEGSIIQLKNGLWQARISVRQPGGELKRIAFYGGGAVSLPGQGLALHVRQPAYAYGGALYPGLKLGGLFNDFEKMPRRLEFRIE